MPEKDILALIERRLAAAEAAFRASPEYAALKAEIEEMFNHGSNCDRRHPPGTDCPNQDAGLGALIKHG